MPTSVKGGLGAPQRLAILFQANVEVVECLAVLLLALHVLDARESNVSLTPEVVADCIEKLIQFRRVCNGNHMAWASVVPISIVKQGRRRAFCHSSVRRDPS